jgi:hypothetical protein
MVKPRNLAHQQRTESQRLKINENMQRAIAHIVKLRWLQSCTNASAFSTRRRRCSVVAVSRPFINSSGERHKSQCARVTRAGVTNQRQGECHSHRHDDECV